MISGIQGRSRLTWSYNMQGCQLVVVKSSLRNLSLRIAFGNIVLVVSGVVLALGLMELLLRIKPDLVPNEVRVDPPVRRVHAFRDEAYDVKLSDGDLFYWLQGDILPLQPDQDQVIARVHYTTDANGFRNPPHDELTYDIVALGDSFTEAQNMAVPWPQRLAEHTGRPTLNLGETASGPQQQLDVLRQYGLKKQPQWVIMAYFEGNDLHDTGAYAQAQPFIVVRLAKYLLMRGKAMWSRSSSDQSVELAATTSNTSPPSNLRYRYPVTITIENTDLEMAFYPNYIAWLSASREIIETSRNYPLLTETILQARELSEASGARFLLVYIPTKAHVYLPYLNDPKVLGRVLVDVQTVGLNKAGFLEFTSQTATPDLVHKQMGDQEGVLADFAAEHDIAFLDLTSHFQAEADAGAELYIPFDTHWNQRGHDLAAQVIASLVGDVPANKSR